MYGAKRKTIISLGLDPSMNILVRRVSSFMGIRTQDFIRLATYEKLYRHMKEGLLEHRLLAQPITPEEQAMVIKWYEEGKLK